MVKSKTTKKSIHKQKEKNNEEKKQENEEEQGENGKRIEEEREKKYRYFKRSIIKLGSSYAVTFPKKVIEPWIEDLEKPKNTNVHCYTMDSNSVLIRKTTADDQKTALNVEIKTFPVNLLPKLLNSANKLNITAVDLDYNDDDDLYDRVMKIINAENFTAMPVGNKIRLDLSKNLGYNFAELVNGMAQQFSKIIKLTVKYHGEATSPDKISRIDTYLSSLDNMYKESLSSLINILNNYYTQIEPGTSNIINALGNRVLISDIKRMSESVSNLFYYKNNDEMEKYIELIETLPDILSKEIELIFSSEDISEIDNLNTELTNCGKKLPKVSDQLSADEAIIRSIIRYTLNTLSDILEIILTRWIEGHIKYE